MTADLTPDEEELRAAVHALVAPILATTRAVYGPVPGVRSTAWWSAPAQVRLAAVLVVGEGAIAFDPERVLDDRLKSAASDVSEAADWTAAARHPSHTELERRRAEPGTAARTVNREAAAEWARTGRTPGSGAVA